MAEAPPPETPTQAARVLIGWFAGGLAFQSVETFAGGSRLAAAGYGIAAIIVAIADYNLKWLLSKSPALTKNLNIAAADARWWIGVAMLTLFVISVSPFIEQKRWPFSAGSSASSPTYAGAVVSQKDYELLGDKLATMTAERDDLKQRVERADQKIAIIQQEIQEVKSKFSDLETLNENLKTNHDDMVSNFHKELDLMNQDRDQLKQQLATAQGNVASDQQRIEGLRSQVQQASLSPEDKREAELRAKISVLSASDKNRLSDALFKLSDTLDKASGISALLDRALGGDKPTAETLDGIETFLTAYTSWASSISDQINQRYFQEIETFIMNEPPQSLAVGGDTILDNDLRDATVDYKKYLEVYLQLTDGQKATPLLEPARTNIKNHRVKFLSLLSWCQRRLAVAREALH
jgi:hypothetical protein